MKIDDRNFLGDINQTLPQKAGLTQEKLTFENIWL